MSKRPAFLALGQRPERSDAVTPGEACASAQVAAVGPGHHIARSTIIGTPLVERDVVDTDVSASRGSSWSTQIV